MYDPRKQAKPFGVTCKPYFSSKRSKGDTNILLNENGKLIIENQDIGNTFNDYFGLFVENINFLLRDEQKAMI